MGAKLAGMADAGTTDWIRTATRALALELPGPVYDDYAPAVLAAMDRLDVLDDALLAIVPRIEEIDRQLSEVIALRELRRVTDTRTIEQEAADALRGGARGEATDA